MFRARTLSTAAIDVGCLAPAAQDTRPTPAPAPAIAPAPTSPAPAVPTTPAAAAATAAAYPGANDPDPYHSAHGSTAAGTAGTAAATGATGAAGTTEDEGEGDAYSTSFGFGGKRVPQKRPSARAAKAP